MLVACFAALTLGAQAKDYKYATVPGDPMHARIYTLDNGLKVYLSVNNEKPRIQTYIAVRTGSRNDPAETTGLAHYLEHLMFKGSQKFGTTDHAKERPYLDDIERRYEHSASLPTLHSANRLIMRLTVFRRLQQSISSLTSMTS